MERYVPRPLASITELVGLDGGEREQRDKEEKHGQHGVAGSCNGPNDAGINEIFIRIQRWVGGDSAAWVTMMSNALGCYNCFVTYIDVRNGGEQMLPFFITSRDAVRNTALKQTIATL